MIVRSKHNYELANADDVTPVRPQVPNEWRTGVLELAERYYRQGHADEDASIWNSADAYRNVYMDLCQLIERVDPRPGAASPAKPW